MYKVDRESPKLQGGPTCPICSVRFPRLSHLTSHICDAHDRWRPHRCDKCNFKSATEEQLKVHRKMTHENPGKHRPMQSVILKYC